MCELSKSTCQDIKATTSNYFYHNIFQLVYRVLSGHSDHARDMGKSWLYFIYYYLDFLGDSCWNVGLLLVQCGKMGMVCLHHCSIVFGAVELSQWVLSQVKYCDVNWILLLVLWPWKRFSHMYFTVVWKVWRKKSIDFKCVLDEQYGNTF